MAPADAKEFYENFLNMVRQQYLSSRHDPEKIKDGEFGAYMSVSIENDGPVTIDLVSSSDTTQPPASAAAAASPAPAKLQTKSALKQSRVAPSEILASIDELLSKLK